MCFVADVLDVLTGVVNTCKTNLMVTWLFESTVLPKQSGYACTSTFQILTGCNKAFQNPSQLIT